MGGRKGVGGTDLVKGRHRSPRSRRAAVPAACDVSRSNHAASSAVGAALTLGATRRSKGVASPPRCCTTKYEHADLCTPH